MGDRAGVNWNKAWLDTFKKNKVSSTYKNGGILRKLQQGGGFPLVQWTPVMGAPYQQYLALLMSGEGGASQKASRSKSSSSDSDKEETEITDNEEYITFEADSLDDLLSKVQTYSYNNASGKVMTQSEKMVGTKIDFRS